MVHTGTRDTDNSWTYIVWRSFCAADLKISRQLAFCAQPNLFRPIMMLLELSGHGVPWLGGTIFAILNVKSAAEKEVFFNLFLGLVVDLLVIALLKGTFRRTRPLYNQMDMLMTVSLDNYSFPSGHATRSAMVMVFLLTHLQLHFGVRLLIVIWGISVGFSRVILGRHHLTDVLVGFLVGYFQYYWILVNIWMSWGFVNDKFFSKLYFMSE